MYRSIPSRFLSELPEQSCKVFQVVENIKKKNMKLEQFSNPDFEVGEKVQHKEFGYGTILGISDNKLQIRFENSDEVIKVFSDFVSKL